MPFSATFSACARVQKKTTQNMQGLAKNRHAVAIIPPVVLQVNFFLVQNEEK